MKSHLFLFIFSLISVKLFAQEVPQLDTTTLINGLKVYYLRQGQDSSIRLRLVLAAGKLNESACEVGYSNVINALLLSTLKRNLKPLSLSEENIVCRTEAGQTLIDLKCSKRYFALTIDLVSKSIRSLPFEKTKLEAIVSQIIDAHTLENLSPERLSEIYTSFLSYGTGNALGRNYCQYQLEKAKPLEFRDFYLRHYQPKICSLIICGDYPLKETQKLVKKHFLKWKPAIKKESSSKIMPAVPLSPGVSNWNMINLFASNDYLLTWTFQAPSPRSTDYLPFLLYCRLLANKGLTPYQLLSDEPQFIQFRCHSNREEVATQIQFFDSLLANFQKLSLTDEAMNEQLQYLKHHYPWDQTAESLLAFYDPVRYDYAMRSNYIGQVSLLNTNSLKPISEKYVHPQRYRLLIVGKTHLVREELDRLGTVNFYESMDFESCDEACREIIIVKCHCETCRLKGRCYVWRFNPNQKEAIDRARQRTE